MLDRDAIRDRALTLGWTRYMTEGEPMADVPNALPWPCDSFHPCNDKTPVVSVGYDGGNFASAELKSRRLHLSNSTADRRELNNWLAVFSPMR